MVELLEKYLAIAVSTIMLVSFASPVLKDGGVLITDCYRTVLVKVLLEEVDFGISETIRTGNPYRSTVLIPPDLNIRGENSQLIISFSAFKRGVTLSRRYSRSLRLDPPVSEGRHLLRITSMEKLILITFRLM